ncbi:MAG TPA: NAD(P)/FAD-dependent oxidoreductase [Candidatus Eisenbacteria bacterium]|jgi:predicted Rossmann fold flavoprotein|nr:NAD(P)/FAD-dependent oxidoreductase [Candidatus Eisenbacteria bacterium]
MNEPNERFDVVVIGGGGAGIAAAIGAGRKGARVLLCEKMPKLAKKVRISGNGRCNLYNDVVDASGYNPEAKEIVESMFSRFGKSEITRFFKELGLRVYSQEDGRVFPVTNQSASVLDLLELELSRLGVEVRSDCEVTSIKKSGREFLLETKSGAVRAGHPVLCAGGKSYPVSGTDGSAYALATAFGHTLVEPVPSTVPLLSDDPWCRHLTGQRIKAAVRYEVDGVSGPRMEGDLLFTDYGLSGLTVLDSSEEPSIAMARRGSSDVSLVADLLPFLHEDELKKELASRLRRKFPTDKLLAGLLPPKFSFVLADVLETRNPAVIAGAVKNKTFKITGTKGWNEAEFTAGGIDHREVDARTLESKKCPGLYLAGEILDVDGKRGGFNLAWAWSSGYVAGQEAASR